MNEDLMRQFLIVLAQGMADGKIRALPESIENVNPDARLEFYRDGPLMVMRVQVVKDRWGRGVDRAGQVKCIDCETRVNYEYPDGSKRERCSEHDGSGGPKEMR